MKRLFSILAAITLSIAAFAQNEKITWDYHAELQEGNEYRVIFTGTIDPGYHTYTLDDPTSATEFLDMEVVGGELVGQLYEIGKPVEEYDENGEVFVQESKPVFEHFTAELPEGFVSLVGPNASGKSTLMMLASGRLCPSSGMVKLFETDTREFFPVIRITKTEEGEKQEIAQPRKTEEEKNILASVIYQNMEFETSEKVEELLKQVFENGEFQGKTPAEFGSENIFEKVIEVFELKEILNCDKNMTAFDEEKYDKNIFEVLSVFKQTREELAHIKKGTKEFTVFLPDDSGVKKYDKVVLSIKEKGCFIFDAETGERFK